MNDPLVSIVVPVYKVEKYIRECIDSILKQTYQNYELILVDDGSPDRCGEICEDYKKKNEKIQVIHKQNGGLSDARNAGTKIAKGEYITYIDSDDYVSENYLEKLVSAAVKYDADFVQGNYTREAFHSTVGNEEHVFASDQAFRKLLTWDTVMVYAWAKLYRLSMFQNIEYPVGRLNEDCCTTYKLILNSNKVVCIDDEIYYYRITPNSILTSKFNVKRFELWKVPEEIKAYLGNQAKSYKDELEYYKMRIGINLLNDSSSVEDNPSFTTYQKDITSWLKQCNRRNPYTNKKYRLLVFVAVNHPALYKKILRRSRKI